MKVKSLVLLGIGFLAVLGMSGCSKTAVGLPVSTKIVPSMPNNTKEEIFFIGTKNDSSNSLSRASDIEESAYFTLQHVAETAIARENKYFAVYKPKALSNFDGSTITSMKEFVAKCGTSAGGGFGSAFDAFGLNSYYCNIGGVPVVHTGFMEVAFYKEKPTNVLVWNAQNVIDYLKKEKLYKKYNPEEVEIIPSTSIGGSGEWVNNLRNRK